MERQIRPLNNYLLVERSKREERITAGGIVVPSDKKKAPDMAKIIACDLNSGFKAGDVIILPSYMGYDIEIEESNYTLIASDEVMAVIHEEESS